MYSYLQKAVKNATKDWLKDKERAIENFNKKTIEQKLEIAKNGRVFNKTTGEYEQKNYFSNKFDSNNKIADTVIKDIKKTKLGNR